MKVKIGQEDPKAREWLSPAKPDGSGVGINYADAYIKAIKATLDDGRKVSCRRKGLKLTLSVGDRSGEGLLRRLEHGPEVETMLQEALREAGRQLGASISVEDGAMWLELANDLSAP